MAVPLNSTITAITTLREAAANIPLFKILTWTSGSGSAPFYWPAIVASVQTRSVGFSESSKFALFMADFYFYLRMTSARHIIADFVLENGCFWLGGALEGFWENKFSFTLGATSG